MKFDNNIPIYVQIMEDIKSKIMNGSLKELEKIPSIRSYCIEYEVTSLTMQRAISELEREGILTTQKGVGSFVNKSIMNKLKEETSKKYISAFVNNMRNIGYSNTTIVNLIKEELKNE